MAILTQLGVPGDQHAWTKLGFTVADQRIQIGQVCCVLSNERSWGFDEIHSDATVLGIPTTVQPVLASTQHACGVTRVDHVVCTFADLDAGITALSAVLTTPLRRRCYPRGRSGPEMAFYRVGEAFIELVAAGTEPALIGLALWSADLDATVSAIRAAGGPISDPKPAVQGGRIATVWRGHLDWGLAIMGP